MSKTQTQLEFGRLLPDQNCTAHLHLWRYVYWNTSNNALPFQSWSKLCSSSSTLEKHNMTPSVWLGFLFYNCFLAHETVTDRCSELAATPAARITTFAGKFKRCKTDASNRLSKDSNALLRKRRIPSSSFQHMSPIKQLSNTFCFQSGAFDKLLEKGRGLPHVFYACM